MEFGEVFHLLGITQLLNGIHSTPIHYCDMVHVSESAIWAQNVSLSSAAVRVRTLKPQKKEVKQQEGNGPIDFGRQGLD